MLKVIFYPRPRILFKLKGISTRFDAAYAIIRVQKKGIGDYKMSYTFAQLKDEYRKPVIDIFNYYIENSFAAFPEEKVSYNFFDILLKATAGYPAIAVKAGDGEVVGFAFLRPYHSMPVFKRAAEATYFIKPEHTGKGIGRSILEYLTLEAEKIGVDTILACISSLNENSLNFHHRNGFQHSGTLYNIGRKFNRDFSVHLMQKIV